MEKALNLCKLIRKEIERDWSEEIEDNGLLHVFQSVLNLNASTKEINTVICYITYAYSPDSLWLDLKKDRLENKLRILNSLGADPTSKLYDSILRTNHETVGISIFNFLEELKDYRWRSVFDLLEYAAKMSRFASTPTEEEKSWDQVQDGNKLTLKEDIDPAVIVRINKEKGILLEEAHKKREQANKLIEEIKKSYLSTDLATQSDFGFNFSETAKKRNILSWREYIKERNEKKEAMQAAQ